MIVHALTPVTRPENLPAIEASIDLAAAYATDVEVVWTIREDPGRRHIGGWALRNRMLDEIDDGWIWLLDDDTIAHPRVLEEFSRLARDAPAFVFSQDGRPAGFPPAVADPARLRNGDLRDRLEPGDSVFDAGMAIVRRDLIGRWRFREHRAADGYYWDEVIRPADGVVYLDEVLCYYNALRQGEWG